MKKIIINATILVDDNLNPIEIESMLDNIGQLQSSTIDCIGYRPVEDRNHHVWVHCSGDDSENLVLVHQPGSFDGVELTDTLVNDLVDEGVCVAMQGYYPRADRYGAPFWAAGNADESAAVIPSEVGFYIASEGFSADCHDTQDDSGETFWFMVAVKEDSRFLTMLHGEDAKHESV